MYVVLNNVTTVCDIVIYCWFYKSCFCFCECHPHTHVLNYLLFIGIPSHITYGTYRQLQSDLQPPDDWMTSVSLLITDGAEPDDLGKCRWCSYCWLWHVALNLFWKEGNCTLVCLSHFFLSNVGTWKAVFVFLRDIV